MFAHFALPSGLSQQQWTWYFTPDLTVFRISVSLKAPSPLYLVFFLSFKMQNTSSSLNESQLSPFHLFITQMTQWFLRLLASALFIYLCIIRAGNNTFLLEIAVSWCRNGKTFGLLHIFKSDVIKKREHLFLTFLSVFNSLKREEFSDAWPNLKTWTSANLAQKSKRRSSNVLFLLLFSLERHLKSPQQSNCRYRLFF